MATLVPHHHAVMAADASLQLSKGQELLACKELFRLNMQLDQEMV